MSNKRPLFCCLSRSRFRTLAWPHRTLGTRVFFDECTLPLKDSRPHHRFPLKPPTELCPLQVASTISRPVSSSPCPNSSSPADSDDDDSDQDDDYDDETEDSDDATPAMT